LINAFKNYFVPAVVTILLVSGLYYASTTINQVQAIGQTASIYKQVGPSHEKVGDLAFSEVLFVRNPSLFGDYLSIIGTDYFVAKSQVADTNKPQQDLHDNFMAFPESIHIEPGKNLLSVETDEIIFTSSSNLTLPVKAKFADYYWVEFIGQPFKIENVEPEHLTNNITLELDRGVATTIPILHYSDINDSPNNTFSDVEEVSVKNFETQMAFLNEENFLPISDQDFEW